jgi:DNA-binding NarL/FixJ family response regulator
MNKTILLSVEQRSYQELLRQTLESHSQVEIIAESCNFIECLALISQRQPTIWIHAWEDSPELRAVLDRAYEVAPELVIVRANPNESTGVVLVKFHSIQEVLGLIDHLSAEPALSNSH